MEFTFSDLSFDFPLKPSGTPIWIIQLILTLPSLVFHVPRLIYLRNQKGTLNYQDIGSFVAGYVFLSILLVISGFIGPVLLPALVVVLLSLLTPPILLIADLLLGIRIFSVINSNHWFHGKPAESYRAMGKMETGPAMPMDSNKINSLFLSFQGFLSAIMAVGFGYPWYTLLKEPKVEMFLFGLATGCLYGLHVLLWTMLWRVTKSRDTN